MTLREAYAALEAGRYAFADLGSGRGGSLRHCARRFERAPGIGFEIDASDAAAARRGGLDVVTADATALRLPERSVELLSAMDFLEHLPNARVASDVLRTCARAARDFVFIRHPSFEEMAYVESLGVRFCWTDWSEHPNMMLLEDYERLFEAWGWHEYAIVPRKLHVDASDDEMTPLTAPRDTEEYDPVAHEPKPLVRFDRPLFSQFDIFVRLGETSDDEWKRIVTTDLDEDAAIWPMRVVARGRRMPSTEPPALAFGAFTPATGVWEVRRAKGEIVTLRYGAAGRGWLPFVGDFDGDRSDGIGAYDPRSGDFFMRNSLTEGDADLTVGFGAPNGLPIAGDWTGSGVDTLGVYMPETGQWFLKHENVSGAASASFGFGASGRGLLPVAGDWNGDGRDEIGLYDPRTGGWHLRNGGAGGREDASFTWGPPNALPVAGDWNGDGRDSIGLYVPAWGLWILRDECSNGPADVLFSHRASGEIPFVGRWS
jgi:hypothetical protein